MFLSLEPLYNLLVCLFLQGINRQLHSYQEIQRKLVLKLIELNSRPGCKEYIQELSMNFMNLNNDFNRMVECLFDSSKWNSLFVLDEQTLSFHSMAVLVENFDDPRLLCS